MISMMVIAMVMVLVMVMVMVVIMVMVMVMVRAIDVVIVTTYDARPTSLKPMPVRWCVPRVLCFGELVGDTCECDGHGDSDGVNDGDGGGVWLVSCASASLWVTPMVHSIA
jgi:hypothetical protein